VPGQHGAGADELNADRRIPEVVSFTLPPQRAPVYNTQGECGHCFRVGQQALLVYNMSAGNPNPPVSPKPVTLANPPFLSGKDYAQLAGLTFAEKVDQMRAILQAVKDSRTPAEIAKYGDFLWIERLGPSGEVLFVGQGGPGAAMNFPTVTIIMPQGEVYRMFMLGLTGTDTTRTPPVYLYDLQKGKAQLMVI
jgi:hypothetical protein